MIINKYSLFYTLLVVIISTVFCIKPSHAATECVPWTPEYVAGCLQGSTQADLTISAQQYCKAAGVLKGSVKLSCKTTAGSSMCSQSERCCQWYCQISSAPISNDCSGFCVPDNQCAPGSYPAPALSDPSQSGSCNAIPNTVCCGQQIVTPEGQAPGTPEADAAAAAAAQAAAQAQTNTQVGSDCREPTTGLNFPCIAQGNPQDVVTSVVARLVNWILTMTGVIFLVMFIWGGISYMIAGGDSSRAEKARKVLVNSFIGIAIILSSYVILDWLFTTLITAIG